MTGSDSGGPPRKFKQNPAASRTAKFEKKRKRDAGAFDGLNLTRPRPSITELPANEFGGLTLKEQGKIALIKNGPDHVDGFLCKDSPDQVNWVSNLKDKNVSSARMGTFACNEQGIQAMVETVKSMIESHNGEFMEFTLQSVSKKEHTEMKNGLAKLLGTPFTAVSSRNDANVDLSEQPGQDQGRRPDVNSWLDDGLVGDGQGQDPHLFQDIFAELPVPGEDHAGQKKPNKPSHRCREAAPEKDLVSSQLPSKDIDSVQNGVSDDPGSNKPAEEDPTSELEFTSSPEPQRLKHRYKDDVDFLNK